MSLAVLAATLTAVAGQFSINLKVPTGTRIEVTEQYVARIGRSPAGLLQRRVRRF